MSTNSSPLLQTITPDRFVGLSMDFIDAGFTGLLVKNGHVVRTLAPGRHFSFALPLLEQAQLILVDHKLRNLDISSQGDFLSQDQFLINLSLSIIYQVIDPQRVALELSDPIATLITVVKDLIGIAISHLSMQNLTNQGRVVIRQYLLDHVTNIHSLGFTLEDVRVSDINFPQHSGVIRQVEGMSAKQEAAYEAELQIKIAQAGRPVLPNPSVQQVNIISPQSSKSNDPRTIETNAVVIEPEKPHLGNLPTVRDNVLLAPTVLANQPGNQSIANLINQSSNVVIPINISPFNIGREPNNHLAVQDPLCSRYHAQIIQIADANHPRLYQFVDLGSSNGTYINNNRLVPHQPVILSAGDQIKIGEQVWVFNV